MCVKRLAGTEYEGEFKAYGRIISRKLPDLQKKDIFSDGYVVHSLEAALWCFLNHDDYSEAVLSAVNLGEDADTISFLTGTMAGMYHRMNGIPEEWINALARKEDIFDLCERFLFLQFCVKKCG